jgi:hypothetical protein
MMLPVEEVCGGKGLIDKYPSPSLYLTFLVIIHRALDFLHGHLQVSWSLRREGVLMETGQMLSIECGKHWWTRTGYRVFRTQGGQENWDPRGF